MINASPQIFTKNWPQTVSCFGPLKGWKRLSCQNHTRPRDPREKWGKTSDLLIAFTVDSLTIVLINRLTLFIIKKKLPMSTSFSYLSSLIQLWGRQLQSKHIIDGFQSCNQNQPVSIKEHIRLHLHIHFGETWIITF